MTLKDIAEMAGVSTMTVSNVINKKTSRVSQKTRDKINSIIEEYNYVPNMNARSLSNNSSHIIGVVIFLEDKDYASGYNYFENPYVSTMTVSYTHLRAQESRGLGDVYKRQVQ